MIGLLKGEIASIDEDNIIINVNGVGYIVYCSAKTINNFPKVGTNISLIIETHVREDQIKLFGFNGEEERGWFRLLTTVQGVGVKVALAILSTLTANELLMAITNQDKTMISRAPGVGAKVAQRIITELKDKAPKSIDGLTNKIDNLSDNDNKQIDNHSDSISALVNLGYAQNRAEIAVRNVMKRDDNLTTTERILREALKELSK